MAQNAAEAFEADVAASDVLVAIGMRTEGGAGIVGVDEVEVRKAEGLFGTLKGGAEPGGGGDVEAGGEEMAGVEAEAGGDVDEVVGELAEGLELFEFAAEVGAGAGGVFEKDGEVARAEAVDGVAEGEDDGGDALFDGLVAIAAGVDDEVFGADGGGAFDFGAEAGDGFGADDGVERGEVDEVVDVDGEGAEVVAFAGGAEEPDLVGVGGTGSPHARAGGEDLEGIGA